MSVLFIDGAGHYGTSGIGKKWTAVDSTDCLWEVVPEGRFLNCLRRTSTAGAGIFSPSGYVETTPLMTQQFGPWTPTNSGVCGFAYKVNDLDYVYDTYQGAAIVQSLLSLYEGSKHILSCSLNSTGTFSLWRESGGAFGIQTTFCGASIEGLSDDIWSYLEFKWVIGTEATGLFQIRANSVLIMDYHGYLFPGDVLDAYTGVYTSLRIGHVPSAGVGLVTRMCDFYMLDEVGAGDIKRDFLGDITIDVIVPEGVGAVSNWTPFPAGPNWDQVEEVPPDEDATFVYAMAPGTRDSYVMQNVPPGTIPLAFQTLIYARKETEGGASLAPTYREGGVYYDAQAQGISTPSEYRYIIQPYDVNPATGLTITEAEINAAEFGVLKTV